MKLPRPPRTKYIDEFKKFAMRGNMMDMAIGIIIGGAFGKMVTSFVNDIIMPPLGVIIGGVDFKDLRLILRSEKLNELGESITPAVTFNYGAFVQNIFDFIIIAVSIFVMIKLMNKMVKKEEKAPAKPAKPTKEELLLEEIRDLLKERK